jgi:ABC-type lipoprotein release transport system permease subunit
LGLTRVISTFLFGVKERDLLVFTAVPLLLCLISFLAVWLPAHRATQINPISALRYE